jgi:hypothetical protein
MREHELLIEQITTVVDLTRRGEFPGRELRSPGPSRSSIISSG